MRSDTFVSLWKTERISKKFIMLLITDYLILSDLSGMMHYMNMEIPCSGDLSGSRIVFIRSMKIALSVLALLGSLNPGESIRVMLPLLAILTTEVTDISDGEASNLRQYGSF